MHNVEWKKRGFFAEIAEALGVTTDSIMAATPKKNDLWWVLYTDEPTDDPEAWLKAATLQRGKDGILRARMTETTIQLGELQKKLRRKG